MDMLVSTMGKPSSTCGNLYGDVKDSQEEKVWDVISYVIRVLESQQELLMSNLDTLFAREEPHTNNPVLAVDFMMLRDSMIQSYRKASSSFSALKKYPIPV